MVVCGIALLVGLPVAMTRGQVPASEWERISKSIAAERAAAEDAAAAAEAARVDALFFGDSVAFGTGRDSDGDPSAAQVAADQRGWTATVSGHPGTGYATASGSEDRFTVTFPEAASGRDFDVIVIEGSSNDAGVRAANLAVAVDEVLRAARDLHPNAAIVLIGPYSPSGSGYEEQRDVLAAKAVEFGVPFIDSIEAAWLPDRPERLADAYRPNTAGHAAPGGLWAGALRAALPAELVRAPGA